MVEINIFAKTFKKYETDKTGYHTYENVYLSLFKDRESVKNILEVGIYMGASLRAWKELFPKANIIGLDYNVENFFSEERITSMYIDQLIMQTFSDFKSVMRNTEFDLIIDDGCHGKEETINTFWQLLPKLSINGFFIVEDIREEYLFEWENICKKINLDESFDCEIINMNDIAKTMYEDNIVFKLKRIK